MDTSSGVLLVIACFFVDVSIVFFAKSSREPTQLRCFSCAPCSCGLASAGMFAPWSIQHPESIATVHFSIAIVVVDLMRCFCFAETFEERRCLEQIILGGDPEDGFTYRR
jgi:hypothetical protein